MSARLLSIGPSVAVFWPPFRRLGRLLPHLALGASASRSLAIMQSSPSQFRSSFPLPSLTRLLPHPSSPPGPLRSPLHLSNSHESELVLCFAHVYSILKQPLLYIRSLIVGSSSILQKLDVTKQLVVSDLSTPQSNSSLATARCLLQSK